MKTFFLSLCILIAMLYAFESRPSNVIPGKLVDNNIVSVKSLKGFDVAGAARFERIARNVGAILESNEFFAAVKGWYTPSAKGFKFHDTPDNNIHVLHKILSKKWELEYRLENMRSSTVGYTYPNVSWIALNRRKFPKMSDAEVAANICHETCHKFGYGHSRKPNKDRPYSVPYGIGFLCKSIYHKTFPSR